MASPSKEDVDSVVDEWITNMLSATPSSLKAQRTAVNEDYEKLLSHMDLSRPEGCVTLLQCTHHQDWVWVQNSHMDV